MIRILSYSALTAGYAIGSTTSGLTATQEAAAVAAGNAVYVTARLQGSEAAIAPVPRELMQSGIPAIIVPNGTVATNGTITVGTALPLIYPQAWVYLPAGAVVGGLVGWYYVIFSSTTVGVVYTSYQATMSTPLALGAAATLTVAVGSNSAYTQATSAVVVASHSVPAGLLGTNGRVRFDGLFSYNNSAGAKVSGCTFGGSTVLTVSGTTTLSVDIKKTVQNRSATQQVIRVAVDSGAVSAVAPTLLAIDTTADVTVAFTGQIAVATDYLILESGNIETVPAA